MQFPRCSGVLLHPTSLPGPNGSGDLGAGAFHFVDWMVSAGQKMWQMLPLGETGPGNSPYMSSSAFAGNPLLIDLGELAEHGWLTRDELLFQPDSALHRIDYNKVTAYRMSKLRLAAQSFFNGRQQPHQFEEYEIFCMAEQQWLEDYVMYKALSVKFNSQTWAEWPVEFAHRHVDTLIHASSELVDEIAFWKFCQWCFFRQWRKLKHYANSRGVSIIGDMPIFVAHQSADVWSMPHLFELGDDCQPLVVAGVPPDYFSETGQRWGNPLFRWPVHEQENFAWWIKRVRKAVESFDVVRIDHFRGFAGYWEIPVAEPNAIKGRWMPGPGEKLFEAIGNELGKLPIIAEDLGVITPDVIALLEKFNLPGMSVLQFAFGGDSSNRYLPHHYIGNMVVYVGTHDNDTTIGWFEKATGHEQKFVCKYLKANGSEINWDLMHAASQSVANLAIYTMQDILGLDSSHRMNIPGKPDGNWEWRFSWDQLNPQHAERLYEMTALHGRCEAGRLKL